MATMIAEVYDALKEAGATEERAPDAARVRAEHDDQFRSIELQLERMRGEMSLLKWMIGFNLAFSVATALRLFFT